MLPGPPGTPLSESQSPVEVILKVSFLTLIAASAVFLAFDDIDCFFLLLFY